MKNFNFLSKTRWLLVPLMLLTLSVGQMWGMNANYTIGSQVTSLVDGDYVAWGTANNNLATSIASNWVYCGSTTADWIVFKVVKISNAFYLQNTADSKYVYSSAAKKVAFDTSNKTAITLSLVTDKGYLVNGGSSIGNYTFNSTGIRPYSGNNYTAANLYKVNAFAVTYNANGADGGTVPTDNGNYLSGATVTAKSNSGSLTRTGYNFVGWNTRADGNGTNIAATGSATFSITASTTLYAKWESAGCANKVNITAGDPESGASFSLDKTGQQNCCSALTVTVSSITAPTGKRFKAITQSGIAAGNVTINNNAKTVTYAANSSGSSTINVTFEDIPSHNINFHINGGSCATSTVSVREGDTYSTMPTITGLTTNCEYGTFVGWTAATSINNGAKPTMVESVTMEGDDVDLYAVYSKTTGGGSTPASITLLPSDFGTSYPSGANGSGTITKGDYSFTYGQFTQNQNGTPQYWCKQQLIQARCTLTVGLWNTTEMDITSVVVYKASPTGNSSTWAVYESSTSEKPTTGAITASVGSASNLTVDKYYSSSCHSDELTDVSETPQTYTASSGCKYIYFAPTNGTSYFTKIVINHTISGGGTTTYSLDANCCSPLGSVSGSASRTSATTATLTWSAVTGAEKYQVKVVGSSSHNDWTDATSGVSVTGLACGTAYTAYFRAIDTNGSHCTEGPESTTSIPAQSWTVTSTGITNATASPAIPSTTCNGFSTTLTAATGYALPAEITVTNADKTWNSSTGALTISNVTGNVVITIAGTCITPSITVNPASAVYSLNESATPLSVTVEGAGAWCGYQWESKVGNGNWTPIQNATSSSYMPSTASAGSTTLYHVIVSNTASGCSTSSTSQAATISVSALPVCASPAFSIAAGTKLGAQSITLSCEDGDATIYYTTNGDDPQERAEDLYSEAIAVNQTTTIKAIATKSGTTTSAVVSATYTIQCKAPTANVSAGTYNVEKSVELSSEYGTVYYTTDGSDPASGTAYNGAIAVSQTTTIRAIAKRANCENSEEFSATYTLKCATPTFSVAAGTHTGAQDVELSCATDGAAIHYTTNGNDPTGSSPTYSEAITVSSAQTIKAIATKSGWSNSDIATAAYTIQYAVKWYVGGTEEANVVSTTYVNAGSKVAPIGDRDGDAIGTCATDFMGWTTEALRNGSVPQTADHYTTLFKYETASASLPTISEATSYYAVFAKEGTGTVTVTDELTYEAIGLGIVSVGNATYTDFSGVSATSDAVYAGNINKFNSSSDPTNTIQLRSNNSSAGIVTTVSGGKAKKVTVTWNTSTAATRTITIYGKNTTAYSAATNLYNNDNKGEQLGELNVDNATNNVSELTITGDYEFIGIRSKSGALYLDEVDIQWETTGTTLTDYVTECPAVVAPTFDIAAGTYNVAQTVKISNYNSDYMYFYTTDNSAPAADANFDPTGTSAVYDNATGIAINGSCTLKAVAYNEDVVASDINSAAYVLQVATPTISGNTSFVNSATVTIEATGADAIYYTTNGNDPTTESTPYTAPFEVNTTTTVKAIAVKANWTNSAVASQAFTKITPLTVEEARTAIDETPAGIANQYVKGIISQIDSYNSTYNSITYWISNDGTTTNQLQVYSGLAGVVKDHFESTSDLQQGAEVIVNGTLKKHNNTVYEFDYNNTIVAYRPFSPIAWSANAYTAEIGGSSNVFPSLSGTAGLTISYSSSDETVATISADGTTYDLKKVGSTTITATSEANASYVATTKSYTLTVEEAVVRYSLSYVKNGGTSDATDSEGETETNLPDPLPTITKAGYNFGGWYLESTFENLATAGAALTENTTLYAQWLEPYTVAQALTIIGNLGTSSQNTTSAEYYYVAGVVTDDAVSVSNNTATYKIKDAGVENELKVYKGKGLNNADVTEASQIQEGDEVVVYGQLQNYYGDGEVAQGNYIYSQVRPTVDVESVSLPSTANVRAGNTITLTATITPANATNKNVTWSVKSGNTYAEVSAAGVVTGLAKGTAVIEVETEDGGFKAECTVTVAAELPTFTEDDHEWIKVSNASKLVAGRFYVIGESSKGVTATNDLSSGYLAKASTTITDGVIASGTLGTNTAIFELGGNASDGWTLYELMDEENTGYLSGTDASNLSWSASAATTSISFDESGNAILGDADSYRMLYNSNSPRFKGYSSDLSTAMLLPQLYMWAELSHSVTFDANGGVAGSVPGIERTDEGKIIIPATTPTHSDISKAFGGWYKSDAPGTLYNAGDEFSTNVDVTLYAKWNTVPTYTVTYVPGGTGTVPAVASYREGQEVQVEEASLSNPGYSFAGWTVKDAEQNVLPLDEENKFDMPASNVTITAVWSRISNQKWTLVKQGETLEIDAEYVIAYNSNTVKKALGAISSNIGTSVDVTIDGEVLKGSDAMNVLTLKAGNGGENYAFQSGLKYLTYSGSSNTLNESETLNDASSWTIEIDENNVATISNVGTEARKLQYNTGSPRFACYTGTQKNVQLYKKAASVVINNAQTVNSADIAANADVTVKNGGTLNVNAAKSIGDLTVEAGGKVTLDANKLTVVGTFTIESTMASGTSGQLTGATASNFAANGPAYIDITLGKNGDPNQWHAFTVPFPVDAINGIYDLDNNKLNNEEHYAIMEYLGDVRAQGKYGWKKIRTTLVPGTFYLMTVDGLRTTYRFKKTADGALVAGNSKEIFEYAKSGDGQSTDAGWNGVGNPTLTYGKVNAEVQVLDPVSYTYIKKDPNSTNFVVGTPFFYQAAAAGSISMLTADADANYAPARTPAKGVEKIKVSFGNEEFTDYLDISASEEALNEYQIGKDLAKMTMTSTPKVAQIFGKAYNAKLCMVYAPMSNDQAVYDLSLYAPANGEYTIAAPEVENADLYLTKDGAIIWNLTMGAYPVDLNKGTTEGYGLLLKAKAPQTPTGVEQSEVSHQPSDIQKIIINDNVFILRGGQLYGIDGKLIK